MRMSKRIATGIEDIEYLKLLWQISNTGDLKAQQALASAQNYLVQSTTCFEQNPVALYILQRYIAEIIESHEE